MRSDALGRSGPAVAGKPPSRAVVADEHRVGRAGSADSGASPKSGVLGA